MIKNKITKTLCLVTMFILVLVNTAYSQPISAENNDHYKAYIEKRVDEIAATYRSKKVVVRAKYEEMSNSPTISMNDKIQLLEQYKVNRYELNQERQSDIKKFFESIGGKDVGVEVDEFGNEIDKDSIGILVDPGALSYIQGAFSLGNGLLYYYCFWDWAYNDLYWDTYDLVSAQMRYDNGWRWTDMRVTTWDENGVKSGWTDGNTITGDVVSLRSDFWNGKIYNIKDYCDYVWVYRSDEVDLSGWIQPGTTDYNDVKSDFEHNWKTYEISSGSIGIADLKNFTLNVTYNKVHNNWQRGTNALRIYKD